MRGKPGGRPKVFGGDTHQKLVEFAENKLRQEGIETILYEVDPGTGISIDILGIKNGYRTGVECYVQAQLKKVRPRIPKLKVDRLIFCVPNDTVAKKYAEFDAEVWNAQLPQTIGTIRVSRKLREKLKELGRKGESYDTIICRLIEYVTEAEARKAAIPIRSLSDINKEASW